MVNHRSFACLYRYALIVVFLTVNNYSLISQEVDLSLTTTYSSLPLLDADQVRKDNKLFATIVLNDFSFDRYDVRLKLTIEGNGITITSSNFFNYRNFTLIPGVPKVMTAFELGDYFDPQSLDFIGMDKNSYLENGILPEGNYKLCFTAIDAQTDGANPISNTECDFLSMRYTNGPIILSQISEAINTNTITWKSNTSSEDELKYELEVYEFNGGDVNNAPIYQAPLERVEITSKVIDIKSIVKKFEKGKLYTFFIHAKSKFGFNHFIKNNGFSKGLLFERQLRADGCNENPILNHEIIDGPDGLQYIHFTMEGCDPFIPPQYPSFVPNVYPYDINTGYDFQIYCTNDDCRYDFEYGNQDCLVGQICDTENGCEGKIAYGCECIAICVPVNLVSTVIGQERRLMAELPFDCTNPQYLWSDGSTSSTVPFPDTEATHSVQVTCKDGCTFCGIINSRGYCTIGSWCNDGNACTIFDELNVEVYLLIIVMNKIW